MTIQQQQDLSGALARKVFQQRGCRLYSARGRQWIVRTVRDGRGSAEALPISAHQKTWAIR